MWFCSSESKETFHVSALRQRPSCVGQSTHRGCILPAASLSHITGKAKALHSQPGGHDTITVTWSSGVPRNQHRNWDLSFSFLNWFWWCMEGGGRQDCAGSSRHPVLLCVCRQGGHGDGLKQSGCHAGGDCQAVTRALEGEIWRGQKRLEDAHQAESRATFGNEIHLVFVRTVKGWNFMKLFWPGYKTDNPLW